MSKLTLIALCLIACGSAPNDIQNKIGGAATVTLTASAGFNGHLAELAQTTYPLGTIVTLTATPEAGFLVASWSGTDDDASVSDTNLVTMNANKTVRVTFLQAPRFDLSLPASIANGTLLARAPFNYAAGTVVPLTAYPADGYVVDAWTGTDDDTSTALINAVTMSANKSASVSFKAAPVTRYTLTLVTAGSGVLQTESSDNTYPAGTVVSLDATPADGHKVASWQNTDDDSLLGPTNDPATTNSVTMNSDVTVTVHFACDTLCTLTLDFNRLDGDVEVKVGDEEITSRISMTFPAGSTQTLVAHDLYHFLAWHGTDDDQGWSSIADCTNAVTLTTDKVVSADFATSYTPGTHCP